MNKVALSDTFPKPWMPVKELKHTPFSLAETNNLVRMMNSISGKSKWYIYPENECIVCAFRFKYRIYLSNE